MGGIRKEVLYKQSNSNNPLQTVYDFPPLCLPLSGEAARHHPGWFPLGTLHRIQGTRCHNLSREQDSWQYGKNSIWKNHLRYITWTSKPNFTRNVLNFAYSLIICSMENFSFHGICCSSRRLPKRCRSLHGRPLWSRWSLHCCCSNVKQRSAPSAHTGKWLGEMFGRQSSHHFPSTQTNDRRFCPANG